ncbi:MAG TPA: hypothetical protein VFY60_05900, partial [Pyrinomonadaceae bacterium]|nr:hypothetical protein [Pyrinomonadaceae bacterium]
QVTDGVGRVIGALSNHPGSVGGYRLVNTVYDQMGRAWLQSNPTEVNSAWVASGDDAAGIYYTQQTYDWQGRPLVTTNPDGTTKTAGYVGCGCAGGEVVTLTDEGTIDGGMTKRRQQKIHSDVLGRTVKTEVLNWQNGDPYAATVNTYNGRNQVTQVRQYAGPEGGSTFQDTTFTYDGYGRVKTRHVPEQSANANTTWNYNPDGTVQKVTDARSAATNYTYNNRHLVTGVTYTVPSQSQVPVPGAVSFSYDAAGNRSTMSDSTGSTSYSYDSLSRLTSESRTFTGLSGSYALNYSYNLANALTLLAIPFKSQEVGYDYDTAGRLSGVTASGFSATYGVWPNLQTQNLSSFASDIAYRAWGARKSMTYGNTTSEQITYNARLQPLTYTLNNMNYQNANTTHSTMTWSYGYYDDGSVKHAWDSTNNWFDRAYKYDHVGRLKEASTFRRARGLSPYPAVSNPDPYHQTISYDAFNHSSRTGLLYTGQPPADTGTYVNNRRTDSGWEYDAEGNTTRDPSYQQTFNAAGVVVHSVSHAKVGDGDEYPLEPRLDITQTYDGLGLPAKREQISRQPGLVDGSGNESAPIEDTQTTHYVRSSVLGGVPIAELGSANTIHIYAGGQRIARDVWGQVTFEHHNPVTGSWVTSDGHSSSRATRREERDPRGAELPLSNPYGDWLSYVDMKFAQPLFIEGGDPFDYSSGRTIDGLPVSEGEFQRRVANGSVLTESLVFGPPGQIQRPRLGQRGSPSPGPTFTWHRNSLLEVISGVSYTAQRPYARFINDNEGTGRSLATDIFAIRFHHSRPQNPTQGPRDCYEFANEVENISNAIFTNNRDPRTNNYPHNINAFMDNLARRFTELTDATDSALLRLQSEGPRELPEFGSQGFADRFIDPDPTSANQARHAVFGLVIGFAGTGTLIRNFKGDVRSPLEIANARENPNTDSGRADIALNNLTVPMGESFRGPGAELRARDLPEWIRNTLCAPR